MDTDVEGGYGGGGYSDYRGGGYSDAYVGDYEDLIHIDSYRNDHQEDTGGYDDVPTYFDDLRRDDVFSEGPPDYTEGPPPPMLLAVGPSIEEEFYSGALPPMPEIDAIFMPRDDRLSPEERREEVDEAFEEFEREFEELEREFLEDDSEEFFEEGDHRLIEEDMPPPIHHEEEFEPMADSIIREEPMVQEIDREIELEVERIEEEPEERSTSVSSANVSIALQASDAAVRQAVEVGAGLSSAEVIAIDAGQVDTSVAVQQDVGQADTPIHIEPIHEDVNHVVHDTTQENYLEEAQQTEETQEDFSFDNSSEAVIDEQFGEQMTQSFATGGNIGTFLSGQSPNFQQFDVRPPEYDVQRDIDQVESAVSSMSSQDISQQAERLAEQIQEGGGFEDDQTIAVTVIGYVPGFESYRQDVVASQREFYRPETVYDGQRNIDDNRTMLFMTQQGDQRHTEMVADQYRR